MADRRTDWVTLLLLLAMYAVLIGNAVLYSTASLPVVLHVLLATIAIHLAFSIWHEAVHSNVSRRPWVNHFTGIAGMLPYMTPYFIQKWVHLRHHSRLNERDDPNVIYTDGPFWQLPLRYPRIARYARKVMADDPRSSAEKVADTAMVGTVVTIYAVAWWLGVLTDLVLLWLLPWVLAKIVMDWYINFLPHVGLPPHRFKGTRIVALPWLTPLVLAHNYHAIHHLWPDTPWHRYLSVYRRRLEYLRENGVPIENRIVGVGSRATQLERQDSISG